MRHPSPLCPALRRLAASLSLYLLLAAACEAAAPAAKILFVRGGVVAVDDQGNSRQLQRGAHVRSGDLLITHDGIAQLRFVDGAIMSLQPATEFRIDDYRFAGRQDGSERGFFSFLKGGMRVLTGLIGHRHRDSFRIQTPVATIGIRGTGFTMRMLDRLRVTVTSGSVALFNDAGALVLDSGETGLVDGPDQPPRKQPPPGVPPAGPAGLSNTPGYRAGDDLGTGLPRVQGQPGTGSDSTHGP